MAHKSSSDALLLERCAVVALGVYLAAVGLHTAIRGQLLYRNYLNAPVLAPIAIAIGVVLILAAFVRRL